MGPPGAMGYQQTLMYGRYSQALGDQIIQAWQDDVTIFVANQKKMDFVSAEELALARPCDYTKLKKKIKHLSKQLLDNFELSFFYVQYFQ
jgi:hypothetical protein